VSKPEPGRTQRGAQKDTPDRGFGLAFRRFFSTTFGGRCPACGRGRIAKGYFQNRDACEHCGARFERGDWGNWMISATLNYFINAVVLLAVATLLVRTYGFFPGLAFVLVGVGIVTALLIYRPVKSLAVWLLWVFGFIYPD